MGGDRVGSGHNSGCQLWDAYTVKQAAWNQPLKQRRAREGKILDPAAREKVEKHLVVEQFLRWESLFPAFMRDAQFDCVIMANVARQRRRID